MYSVLLATHLERHIRRDTIKETLKSITYQTDKPDQVLISYSGVKTENDAIEEEWIDILKPIKVVIERHSEKKFQFEHYRSLLKYIKDEDIVMFIDDDDFYSPNKVKFVKEWFEHGIYSHDKSTNDIQQALVDNHEPREIIHHTCDVIFGPCEEKIPYSFVKYLHNCPFSPNEHWNYSLKGHLFKYYFSDRNNYTLIISRHKGTTDLDFSKYAGKIIGDNHIPTSTDTVYYHRGSWTTKDWQSSL